MKPKNTVTITKGNKEGTMYDIWYDTPQGREKIRRSSTTILKAVLSYVKEGG